MKQRKWIFLWLGLGGCIIFLAFLVSCATQGRIPLRPGAGLNAEADYSGRESCKECHEKRVENFNSTIHARMEVLGQKDQEQKDQKLDLICESCHGPGSRHIDNQGGLDTSITVPSENPEACFQCHRDIQSRFLLKFRHPLPQGKISCADCHDPHGHGEDIYSPAGVKMFNSEDVCYQCHKDKAGPYVFEHEALREGCPTCHNPHGSINDKLLVQRGLNLCLRCHGQIAASGSVEMGDFGHTSRVAEGPCWSAGCHTAVHGSNMNAHLRY